MLQWAQLAAGIGTPVLEDNGRLTYLEGGWIPNLHDGLITIKGQLKQAKHWIVKQQREHDINIMDGLRHDETISDEELAAMNR
eukprot:3433702-Ditylum_brightwellii.AAC.1